MNARLALSAMCIIIFPLASAFSQDSIIETGTVEIHPTLQLDVFEHQLSDNWTLTKVGVDNYYVYSATTPTKTPGQTLTGETLYLDVSMRPIEALTAVFGFEYVINYADAYWRPHNREHEDSLDGQPVALNTANVNYDAGFADLRYVRGEGRLDWSNDGDLFGAFSETLIPQMFEVTSKGSMGSLQLVYGMDSEWEYIDSHPHIGIYGNVPYLNYNFKIMGGSYHFLYKDELSIYDPLEQERMHTYELSGSYEIGDNPLQVGLLYRPFRLGWDYTYLADAPAGAGDVGSSLLKRTGTTEFEDAFGGTVDFAFKKISFLDKLSLNYTYQGLVAGNKQQVGTEIVRRLSYPLTAVFDYTYRRPLLGPIPLIYEGTATNNGPALFEPRGAESPFWVQWDNREASIISFMCTFNPTPSTPFYRYKDNVPEEWNLNPKENSLFSCAARYTLTRYFTGTDSLVYWSTTASPVWEGYGATGAWATNDYIGAFNLLSVIRLPQSLVRFVVDLEMGESLATVSSAYTLSTASAKPITDYLITGVSMVKAPYEVSLKYSKDYWGPEYWQQEFGEIADNVYQVKLTRKFGKDITVGVDYVGVHENDKVYLAPELGDYDEYHCFFTISFGPVLGHFGKEWKAATNEPEADLTPPFVTLSVSTNAFTTGAAKNSTCIIEPRASDINGVSHWELTITSPNGRVVKTFSGKGQPPDNITWDGTDDVYNMAVHSGTYLLKLSATDPSNNTGVTQPVEVKVTTPTKETIKEVQKEVTVTETARGLMVSLTSNVLFDSGQHQLKLDASKSMQAVVKILMAYPENKIMVEGHTDSTGDSAMNQKLSEARAWSVANALIGSGIAKERITVVGFGKTKPVASNATAKGREANRRVEVIILKK
ncbi:MAG: OmpA family protein [Endomicrobiales bacterium]